MTDALIDTDEAESKPAAEQTDDDILACARKDRKACDDADGDNRINAVADLEFLAGGENQWDADAVTGRKNLGRPIITVNTMPTYLHQVTNDQRMNTPAIKVHPVDDKADVETAKVRQGLIRHIEYDSNADVAYDTAVNSAAAVGFGYFRLITDYESESSFDQKIMFQRIRNALSVKILPPCVEPDGSDMKACFVDLLMSKEAFKTEYPEAKAVSGNTMEGDQSYSAWFPEDGVLVADYYRIETEPAEVVLLSNGESGFKKDLLELPPDVTIQKTRPGTRSKVMLYKITAVDILEKTEIKCKWIPVFPVYGDEIDIQGKVIRSGIIRNAKGPAQMYNVMMTGATEEVLLRSKTPYIMAEGQDAGYEDEWQNANRWPLSSLKYKPVSLDGHLAPPPQRNPMADIPAGMIAMAMHASDNVKKTTGLFDASLGAKGTATSGKQELAQQREGDVANFHYMDGLLRTIRHAGRCLNYMLPFYYDTERTVRILGEDDSASYKTINGADGKLSMAAGEYDVTITNGPSFSTARQENAEFFANAMSAAKDPASAATFGYLAIANQDVAGGDLARKMVATTLPPAAKAVLDEEQGGDEGQEEVIQTPRGPLPVSKVPQALQELEMQIAQMGEALQKVDADKQQAELLRQQTAAAKQQEIMAEQQLAPARLQVEQSKIAAEIKKAEASMMAAQADMLRAQAEASAIPANAQAAAMKAETDNMTAQVNLLTAHQQQQIDAAKAEGEALKGDETAFEAWKATLEANTKIEVAKIMAGASERNAALSAKAKSKEPTP